MEKAIPQMDSIKEMAQFWDTHDLTDFEDQLEEVRETVFERSTVWIRFRPDEVEVIKSLARARGISDSNLIREWVLERIHTCGGRP
jgi:predicted DNA binding CopG/RHH family protein